MQPSRQNSSETDNFFTQPFCEAIARRQETISTLERLCVQVSNTLICLAKPKNRGFHPFVRKDMVWIAKGTHSTTAAQCMSGVKSLVRIMRGVKLRTPESSNLLFQTLPEHSQTKLDDLQKDLASLLREQMNYFATNKKTLHDKPFGELNPFTCAHVFSVLAPSEHLFKDNCLKALYGILWALGRKFPKFEGRSGAAMPNSLPSAFITSLCIDAIESLIEMLKRRGKRLEQLIRLIQDLEKSEEDEIPKKYAEEWTEHQSHFLIYQIKECLIEITQDAALKSLFKEWQLKLESKIEGKKFSLESVRESFVEAVKAKVTELTVLKTEMKDYGGVLKTTYKDKICEAADFFEEDDRPKPEWNSLPSGLVDDRFLQASKIEPILMGKAAGLLKNYWADHKNAVNKADETYSKSLDFFAGVIDVYLKMGGYDPATGDPNGSADVSQAFFLSSLTDATSMMTSHVQDLHKYIEASINWSESVMDHQLALARAGRLGEFDVAELAHAARIVVRSGVTKDASGILEAIKVVCKTQYPDGKWPCTQPFFWTPTGMAAYPHSVEVAWALVSIMRTLTANPEMFGLSQVEVLTHMDEANLALERFLRWLSTNVRSYEEPELLQPQPGTGKKPRWIFGWCSDRTLEQDLVHTWATANVAEFLAEFRTYLQEQINTILRVQFLSYHPSDLKSLGEFSPPDLVIPYEERIGTKVWNELQLHRRRAHREMCWIPDPAYEEMPTIWSAILAGPPGSAKSYLAKCIAGELQWPLISLSPSDFLSAGEAEVEARAREIFDALSAGTRLVYFFDEIDELILDRASTKKENRSVFSFLTPSFLTKFQDLRDAATDKSFMFLIGTNYLDRIDPAAKRSGRVDQELLMVYPDKPSRKALCVNFLWKNIKKGKKADHLYGFFNRDEGKYIENLAQATSFLSLPGLQKLCSEISNKFEKEISVNEDDYYAWLDKEISALTNNSSNLAKPEVDLKLYWGRAGAAKEWALMMNLLPEEKELRDKEIKGYIDDLKKEDWNLREPQVKSGVRSTGIDWLIKGVEKYASKDAEKRAS